MFLTFSVRRCRMRSNSWLSMCSGSGREARMVRLMSTSLAGDLSSAMGHPEKEEQEEVVVVVAGGRTRRALPRPRSALACSAWRA